MDSCAPLGISANIATAHDATILNAALQHIAELHDCTITAGQASYASQRSRRRTRLLDRLAFRLQLMHTRAQRLILARQSIDKIAQIVAASRRNFERCIATRSRHIDSRCALVILHRAVSNCGHR